MAAKKRDDAHEILDWQAPTRRVCTAFSEQIHTDVHAGRAHLADKALGDEVMDISKCRCKLPLQANLGFYSSSISEPRQLGRLCGSRRKRPLAVNVLACSDGCADTLLMLLR